ncbi:MAG: MoxR family ATPase [Pseudomonadota bacterium]
MQKWWIYQGNTKPHDGISRLPEPPPWRQFTDKARAARGLQYRPSSREVELVNVALYLRRPLLITGKPGVGKTSLAYAVAHELNLGEVLRWSITTQTRLQDGLYRYDAIARLQDSSIQGNDAPPDIGQYLRLGPLGTAFTANQKPRVLLIDEIDKSDIDLPNDLLHIFEEGEFEIPELARTQEDSHKIQPHDEGNKVTIEHGRVRCHAFPLVIMTSNGEREFPPAFLRRCLQLDIPLPDPKKLMEILKAHLQLDTSHEPKIKKLLAEFMKRRDMDKNELATDQLLNAMYMAMKDIDPLERDREELLNALWRSLSGGEGL